MRNARRISLAMLTAAAAALVLLVAPVAAGGNTQFSAIGTFDPGRLQCDGLKSLLCPGRDERRHRRLLVYSPRIRSSSLPLAGPTWKPARRPSWAAWPTGRRAEPSARPTGLKASTPRRRLRDLRALPAPVRKRHRGFRGHHRPNRYEGRRGDPAAVRPGALQPSLAGHRVGPVHPLTNGAVLRV